MWNTTEKRTQFDGSSFPSTLKTWSAIGIETVQDAWRIVKDQAVKLGDIIKSAISYASTDLDLPVGSREREIFEEEFAKALKDLTDNGRNYPMLVDGTGKQISISDLVFDARLDKQEIITSVAPSILRQSLFQPELINAVRKNLVAKQADAGLWEDEKTKIQKLINLVDSWKFTPIDKRDKLKTPPSDFELAAEDLWQFSATTLQRLFAEAKWLTQYTNIEESEKAYMWQAIILQRAKYLRTEVDRVMVNKWAEQVETFDALPDNRSNWEKIYKSAPTKSNGYDYLSPNSWYLGWYLFWLWKDDGADRVDKMTSKLTARQFKDARNEWDKMSRNTTNNIINSIVANATSEDSTLRILWTDSSLKLDDNKVIRLQQLAEMLAEFRDETRSQDPTGLDNATGALQSIGWGILWLGNAGLWWLAVIWGGWVATGIVWYAWLRMAGKYRRGEYKPHSPGAFIGWLFSDVAYKAQGIFTDSVNNRKYASYTPEAKKKALKFYELDADGSIAKGDDGKPKAVNNESFYNTDEMKERKNAARARIESIFSRYVAEWNDSSSEYREMDRRIRALNGLLDRYTDMLNRGEPLASLEKWAVDAAFRRIIVGNFGMPYVTITDIAYKEAVAAVERWGNGAATVGDIMWDDERTRWQKVVDGAKAGVTWAFKKDKLRTGDIKKAAVEWVATETYTRWLPQRLGRAVTIDPVVRTYQRITWRGNSEHLGKEIMSEIAQGVKQEPMKIKGITYTFKEHAEVKPKMDQLARDIRHYNSLIEEFHRVSEFTSSLESLRELRELNTATPETVWARIATAHWMEDLPVQTTTRTATTKAVIEATEKVRTARNAPPPEFQKMIKAAAWNITPDAIFNRAEESLRRSFEAIGTTWDSIVDAAKAWDKFKFAEYAKDLAKEGHSIPLEDLLERWAKIVKAK